MPAAVTFRAPASTYSLRKPHRPGRFRWSMLKPGSRDFDEYFLGRCAHAVMASYQCRSCFPRALVDARFTPDTRLTYGCRIDVAKDKMVRNTAFDARLARLSALGFIFDTTAAYGLMRGPLEGRRQ